jgi:hypothetical protein
MGKQTEQTEFRCMLALVRLRKRKRGGAAASQADKKDKKLTAGGKPAADKAAPAAKPAELKKPHDANDVAKTILASAAENKAETSGDRIERDDSALDERCVKLVTFVQLRQTCLADLPSVYGVVKRSILSSYYCAIGAILNKSLLSRSVEVTFVAISDEQ